MSQATTELTSVTGQDKHCSVSELQIGDGAKVMQHHQRQPEVTSSVSLAS